MSTAAIANPAIVLPEPQPQLSALIKVNTREIVPSVIASAPPASYPRFAAPAERLSGTKRAVSANTQAPIGTLMKNTHRQLIA